MNNALIAIAVFVIVAVLGLDAGANLVEENFRPVFYAILKIIGIVWGFLVVVVFLMAAFWIKWR